MTKKCIAITKAGNPCKNMSREGYQTCYPHRAQEPVVTTVAVEKTAIVTGAEPPIATQATKKPAIAPEAQAEPNTVLETSDELGVAPEVDAEPAIPSEETTEQDAKFQQVLNELDDLAKQLKNIVPGYDPPPFSAEGLLDLLKTNADKFAPEVVKDLRASLEGAEPKDFLDVETWKGMWFILNYSLQEESRSAVSKLGEQVSRLPGMSYLRSLPGASLVQELGEMLSDTSPKDFLDVDTWKGMWFVVNYSLQNEAREMKSRIFGEEEE